MANIILKKSSVADRIPDSSDLEYGELAVNYHDGYLYYKSANNAVNRFLDSAAISALVTTNLTSGRDSATRAAISSFDGGGDGSFSYSEATGIFTYNGPTATEARAHFSASGDLSYNASTGDFSVTTYKDADFDTRLALKTTDDLSEGANLYYTEARVDSDFDTRLGIKNTGNLAEGSNLYYTDTRADARVVAVMDSDRLDLLAKDYGTLTGTQTLTNKTLTSPIIGSPTIQDSAGNAVTVLTHAYSGISFNTASNFGDSNHTVFHIGGDSSRETILSIGKNDQFQHAVTVTGTQDANDFIIGFQENATNFRIQKDVGNGTAFDIASGTDLFVIDSTGIVTIPNNTQSTNKTSGALVVTGGVGVSGDLRGSEIIASGNVQAQGAFIGDVTGQVSDVSNHNTGDISEGSNLYYTAVRVDSDFDTRLATKNTDNLDEGNNLYYTTARADSDAKNAISITDAGGDGSLSYIPGTGVITYQGPIAADTRAHFSGGTGVTIIDGSIAIGQDVGTGSVVTFAGGSTISGNLNVSGDLIVGGDQINNQVTDLRVTNAMIKLADSNSTDAVDIGLVGRYSDDGGTTIRRAGFVRDASNGEFYAFQGLVQDGLDSSVSDQTINVNGTGWELGTWNFGSLRGQYLGFDSDFREFQSDYKVKTSAYTAVAGDRLAIDTSGGAFTVTLPANPNVGNTVHFIDIGNWNATNYLEVARNGQTIEGNADNFQLDLGQNTVDFIFINNTWNVYAAIGQRGPEGPAGAAGVNADSDTLNQNAIAYAIALG